MEVFGFHFFVDIVPLRIYYHKGTIEHKIKGACCVLLSVFCSIERICRFARMPPVGVRDYIEIPHFPQI